MVKKIKINTVEDLKEFMSLTSECENDVGVHTPNNQIADAKSILGLIALDYSMPVLVVTEDAKFLKKLDRWAAD